MLLLSAIILFGLLVSSLSCNSPSSTLSFNKSKDLYKTIDVGDLISNHFYYKDTQIRLLGKIELAESNQNDGVWWIVVDALPDRTMEDLRENSYCVLYGAVAGTEELRMSDGVLLEVPVVAADFTKYYVVEEGTIVISSSGERAC